MRLFAFLLFTYANLSHALGIGDIALKSYLGEPLIAKIDVTDVEKSPDIGCFSVTDASDVPAFKKANVSLTQHGDAYQLNITTHNAITEPIVNLHVSFQCEPNFNREYVLLLDPVTLVSMAAAGASTQPATPNASDKSRMQPLKSTANIDKKIDSTSNAATPNDPIKVKQAKKKKFKKNQLTPQMKSTAIDEKLLLSYTGKQQAGEANSKTSNTDNKTSKHTPDTKQPESPVSTSKPYLVISSGNINSNEHATQPTLSLRLETKIDFARVETATPLTSSDAMDEVTVMANRLAHMEKQIISLQTKNAQLLNQAEQAEQAKNVGLKLEQQSQWLQNILIVIGILSALAGAEWVRRKTVRNRLNKEQAIWFDAEKDVDSFDPATVSSAREAALAKDNIFDDPTFDPSTYSQLSSQNQILSKAHSFVDEENSSDDNILENADVFIEHGRPALAIQLLQNHLSDFPAESPKTWLKLLNLLASEGAEADYDNAVAECRHFFNIKMPRFAEATILDDSSIENFTHIVSRLEGVWGSQFAVGFLSDLINNQQSQPKEGFERGTFEELFFLKQIAEILSSNTSKEQNDPYHPASIKPTLDNLAFNDATFGGTRLLNATKVSDVVEPQDQALTTEHSVDNLISNISNDQVENSPFQTVPAYEVDMLLDFDEALEMKEGMATDAFMPESNTATHNVATEINQTLQSNEISFSIPTDNILKTHPQLETDLTAENASLGKKPKSKKSKNSGVVESNVIEWDLPKLS